MTLRILAPLLIPLLSMGLASPWDVSRLRFRPLPPDATENGTQPIAADGDGDGDSDANQTDDEASGDSADPADTPDPAPQQIIDVVLPCGLRVITAKDASLPVAAVVLALELGTRDDPENLPGLIHALAYHLQQGNRELAPGEAIATAHDVGGLAAMAVGVAQVRYESLVPISQLDQQLRVEALRLRAPNTGRELWLKSLSYARSDDRVKPLVPPEAGAVAWQDPGMAHDGRQVVQALGDMLDQGVGAQLSRFYDYRLATLVVVGPDEPQALL
ncbi:insulinase family protein, partial [Enhygromyxa salina]|uniref:insulinase family protein n=1 Tax=Enhygromyxa salina TaxID=215803 RepID=UPI0011BA6733